MRAVCFALCLLLLCTGCWDMKEINQLAIVSLGGTDKDPKTGEFTAYYQVINPSGLSSRQGGASKAAVYTYRFRERSLGQFAVESSTAMPRMLFMPHLQAMIVSERYAKQGIIDLLNYYELSPDRRTNVILIVTDSPIDTVLNTFTPLERVPGRYLRSLIDLSGRGFPSGIEPVRMKDMMRGLERSIPTVVPLIHYTGSKPADKADKLDSMNATEDGLNLSDGAVFVKDRMVGRVSLEYKLLFFVLNERLARVTDTVKVGGAYLDLEAQNIRIDRHWSRTEGLTLNVAAELRIMNNQQSERLSVLNLREVEKAFDKQFAEKSNAFVRLGKRNGWDLLGLQDMGAAPGAWRDTPVRFKVSSIVTTVGNTSGSYTTPNKE